MLRYKHQPMRYSTPRRAVHEPVVQNGLALTPDKIEYMSRLGQPVTTQTLGAEYYDNTANNDYYVPLEHRRGMDIVDVWNAMKDGKTKLRNALSQPNAVVETSI